MKSIFADTSYFIALLNPNDNLHHRALEIRHRLHHRSVLTSQMVLVELLNDFSGKLKELKSSAIKTVRFMLDQQDETALGISVVPQTHEQFISALTLYAQRIESGWSLTDCASYLLMRDHRITEAITHDRHFEQMGFKALLRPDA